MKQLVVMGQGYVGLPMALRAAACGLCVVGFDTNAETVHRLNGGRSHVDDVSDDELCSGLAQGYQATSDPTCLSDAEAIVVCVPTPLHRDGGPDLTAIVETGRLIGDRVRPGSLVVLESTTYPGTTEEVFAPLVLGERFEVGVDLHVAFSPERIDPGNARFQVHNTPKVVGGLTPACAEVARDFYSQFIETVVVAKSAREAEMAKVLENTFRHVNIALMNEMVRFCHDLSIDLWNAIDVAASKPFGYLPFRPGPGVGGHCIPIDPTYLSYRVKAELGYAFRMVELAEEINKAAPMYVADRAWAALNSKGVAMRGASVLLLGVTYKPDVSDRRESPADPLGRRLSALGAQLSYHDPFVPKWQLTTADHQLSLSSVADVYAEAEDADLVILLQPHDEYDLERLSHCSRMLLDTRGAVPGSSFNVERL